MGSYFNHASNFRIENVDIQSTTYNGTKSALERLEEHISTGAAFNSDERCDAPKCHPETRLAVQDETMSWITAGDTDAEPKRILWLTGPAGTGKTAIAGSVAETCSKAGLLVASFFFSSFSGSADRRSKRFIVPTLAYQLRKHQGLAAVGRGMLSTIEHDPAVFTARLKDQLEDLILKPFRQLHGQLDASSIPKVIIVDGIDECEGTNLLSRAMTEEEARAASERDHLEILDVLLQAASDPTFPFRIIAVSRPERHISTFFDSIAARAATLKIFLDETYDPDSDITLFLQSKFAEIRRRYHLPPSWPSEKDIRTLVSNASGQFIYATTVIRFVEDRTERPQAQLNCVLNLTSGAGITAPYKALDALYIHILKGCPDPTLTVKWIRLITSANRPEYAAHFWRLYLESTPGEMEYVLGCIASLIYLPDPEDRQAPLHLFHKSLQDFVGDDARCGELYRLDAHEFHKFVIERYFRILRAKGPPIPGPEPEREEFLNHFILLYGMRDRAPAIGLTLAFLPYDPEPQAHCDARWWVDWILDNRKFIGTNRSAWATTLLHTIHSTYCSRFRCLPGCKLWRKAIIEGCKSHGYKVPGPLQLLYLRLAKPWSPSYAGGIRRLFDARFFEGSAGDEHSTPPEPSRV
ncbi:hypothetical protein D9611_011128 [Ephemerocybe angulata]|uniref:Nephrocystin 3-like N-terminal domain-containing protein n=1 Tax=Ephemerocybe angulata TaxID=980116 RepID=A0A8H5FJL7_9AGAR|nr:hypothetical protein D9611_011128 [Tulosesus angulatus]